MHAPSKVLILSQFIGSLVIVVLVSHASSYGKPFFGASPPVMALHQLAAANLFLSLFILVTALHTDKIYETPLICLHGMLFFVLLFVSGVLSIVESVNIASWQEKETVFAGVVAIFTAVMSVAGCCFSYNICQNMKNF